MNEPERSLSTFHAFCSLVLPGLGQLLQKRIGAAIGFFTLFILSGFLPVLIVCLLFMDRFSYQPLRVHLLHIFAFGGLYFLFLLVIFWAVLDAVAGKSREKQRGRFHPTAILWIVIASIGFLVILLLPSVPTAREAARRMQCNNNMKQIMFAFHYYHDVYRSFPPAYTVDENGRPLHSWRVLILPYLEQNELYEKIRLDEPWDSEYNRRFHVKAPSCFQCPSCYPHESVPVPVPGGCFYSVIDGAEAAFWSSHTKSMAEMKTTETIFLAERRMPVNWMDPSREITFETACKGVNVDGMGISSYHVGGVNVAWGDGAVDFLSDSIGSEQLQKMLMVQ